jgi:hypothetical protein
MRRHVLQLTFRVLRVLLMSQDDHCVPTLQRMRLPSGL